MSERQPALSGLVWPWPSGVLLNWVRVGGTYGIPHARIEDICCHYAEYAVAQKIGCGSWIIQPSFTHKMQNVDSNLVEFTAN